MHSVKARGASGHPRGIEGASQMSHPKPSEKRKGLGAGIIAFGVVFALFSLLFRPHTVGAFALATALSLFAGAVIRVMAQGLDVSPTVKTPESLQKVQGNTGDPDVDALLEKGRGMIAEIRAENDRIPDSSLSDKLEKLENLCAEVFRAVYDKPAKAPQIRKFMDYYLPTTLKMVRGFRTLDERGITGAQAQDARRRIGDALDVVIHGCQRLLENLYRDDVLDLTTDIDVLEQMLKRDGLTESDLERAAAQAREAARIDAEANRISRERAARGNVSAQGGQASATATRPNDRT
jgi:hypothetical protein